MRHDLGAEIRRVRESKKLSLRAIATSIGVSPSLLSQVETGKTQPSVSTLYALVNHLGISLDALLGTNGTLGGETTSEDSGIGSDGTAVQRKADNPIIEMQNGVTWERLAVGSSDVAIPVIVTYAPGGASSLDAKLMRHAGLEYGYILEGNITLKLEFETTELQTGDSFCFDSGRPHLFSNDGDRPAKGVWFVIGQRDAHYKTLADLGHEFPNRPMSSAVDVIQAMRDGHSDAS